MYELQTRTELLHSAMNNTEIKGFAPILYTLRVWSMAKGRKPLENKNIEWHLSDIRVMTILSGPT